MKKNYPLPGRVYTLREIQDLDLRDGPALGFYLEGKTHYIQDAHFCSGEEFMNSVPGFADTEWRYIRETNEWIPLFQYVGQIPITEFVERYETIYDDTLYAPKGHVPTSDDVVKTESR